MSDFTDKKIAILGLGTEGDSVVRHLSQSGAIITIFDEKEESELTEQFVNNAKENDCHIIIQDFKSVDLGVFDFIFRSPGVRLSTTSIQNAIKKGVRVTSATKHFFEKCPAPIIGVTGTKGKGTTSTLIYEMLKAGGKDAYIGGNIGTPALDFLDNLNSESIVVLELSSFSAKSRVSSMCCF